MHPTSVLRARQAVPAVKGVRLFADEIDLSIHGSVQGLKEEWETLEKIAPVSVYQRFEWIETYLKEYGTPRGEQPFIAVGRHEGRIVFILPMSIHESWVRRLKFVGGSHVNFNIGLVAPEFADKLGPQCFDRIYRRLRRILPGVGYIALCCQPETWLGRPNPVRGAEAQRTGNPAYVLDLEGGFDATLDRGNAKRKRKKFRQQVRMAEEMGGHEFLMPRCLAEIEQIIDIFFEQKSRRLKELGIRDVFADHETKTFLKTLARKSIHADEPLLQIFALKVGEEIVAIFGGGSNNNRFSGYFSSIASGWEKLSPGEMLLYLVVEELCRQDYIQMDLGAGDERYKRSWSSERIETYETLMPFNRMALPVIILRRLFGNLRRIVREDERYWSLYKDLRKLKARLPF